MATNLLYLDDFDIISNEATVIDIEKTEDGRTAVMLDQTCFYPRGGGQDWDTGTIEGPAGSFTVEEVRLDEQGNVKHIGSFRQGEFALGDTVDCRVDEAIRQINTKLHSAGHLIDMAMTELQPDWTPGRGAHYPHMSFVEYSVPEGTIIQEGFSEQLQNKLVALQQTPTDNQIRFMPKEEMARYCRHVPDNIPTNKPARIVIYADTFGSPCGGTHVRRLADIGTVGITKIKVKKGLAKVSYAVAGIN